jgi:hypothetical protein
MTAQITRFYSRAELGMRAPTGVSYDVHPEDGGVAIHYGGNGPNPEPATFERYKSIWLSWQRMHMDNNGWRDIGYTAGFNNLGQVFAGRGLGVRTGANGSNYGNESWLAFVWIGGGSYQPNQLALDAADWLIHWARTKDDAASDVSPHKRFTATTCCGPHLTPYAASRDGKTILLPNTTPVPVNPYTVASPGFPLSTGHWFGKDDGTPYSHSGVRGGTDDDNVKKIQAHVNTWLRAQGKTLLSVDGDFGSKTEAAVKSWQYANRSKIIDGKYNGLFGRNSWNFAF